MIIGITGTFGTGKTTVANMFSKYGFKVINVDKLYRGIYNKNDSLKKQIKKEFGTTNRTQLKEIVFNDYKKLKKLNNITHPIIINSIKKEIKSKKIIIDAPLLIEAKAKHLVDKLIVVKCSKKEQIKRALKKKKYTKKEIENIIKSQIPIKEKIKHSDFVVDNNGTIKTTAKQVKTIVNFLQKT